MRHIPAAQLHLHSSPSPLLTQAAHSSEYAPPKWHGTDDFCSAVSRKSCWSLGDKSVAGVAFQASNRGLALLLTQPTEKSVTLLPLPFICEPDAPCSVLNEKTKKWFSLHKEEKRTDSVNQQIFLLFNKAVN